MSQHPGTTRHVSDLENTVLYRAARYAKLMKEWQEMVNRLEDEESDPLPTDSIERMDALFDDAQDMLEDLQDAGATLNPLDYL